MEQQWCSVNSYTGKGRTNLPRRYYALATLLTPRDDGRKVSQKVARIIH
jgi:hypothetical protein